MFITHKSKFDNENTRRPMFRLSRLYIQRHLRIFSIALLLASLVFWLRGLSRQAQAPAPAPVAQIPQAPVAQLHLPVESKAETVHVSNVVETKMETVQVPNVVPKLDPWDPLLALNGRPTKSFRDNLRNDTKYITSWIGAGFTNDVMTFANLIYLAILTDRTPILSKFVPVHVGGHVPPISFGEVFDLPRLRKDLGLQVLEWHEVKDERSSVVDDMGCWSVWQAVNIRDPSPRGSRAMNDIGIDASYTSAPESIKITPGFEHDQHCTFWSLVPLAFPHFRDQNLKTQTSSSIHRHTLPPDDHLLCYDYLYYVVGVHPFEFEFDYSPAWRFVAQHMRWTHQLDIIADSYVRKAINVPNHVPTPFYITIHVRHHDFKDWCGDVPVNDCFASLPVIARRVREVQDELRLHKGIDAPHVIMTSDEKDPQWWADVEDQGWLRIDHSMTGETYGEWYPVLIDAVIQSSGKGFVGTDRSTMSMMARRRVETWHGGVTRTVKWGRLDADDH